MILNYLLIVRLNIMIFNNYYFNYYVYFVKYYIIEYIFLYIEKIDF